MCFKLEYTEALIRRTYVKRQSSSNGQLFEHSFLYKYRPISRQLNLILCEVIAFLGWTTFDIDTKGKMHVYIQVSFPHCRNPRLASCSSPERSYPHRFSLGRYLAPRQRLLRKP